MGEKELLELGRLLIDFPLPYETIRGLKITEKSGGHSTLSLKLIATTPLVKADILPLEDTPIKVLTPTGENIFAGICQGIHISNEADYSEITIEAASLSIQTDIKKNKRTFQSGSKTLQEVANTVMGPYGITVGVKNNVTISEMLNQENETDWAFIRRIAAQFGEMIFTDSKSDTLRICIGAVGFKLKELDASAHVVSTEKGIGSFTKIKHNLNTNAEAYEFATEKIESYDLTLGTGQLITKDGAEQVVVGSEIVAKRGTVTNIISLRHQEGAAPSFSQTKEPVMTANILTGTVLAVQGNEIKVHFNVDSSQSPGEAMWIPYEHELNNYMYCMPDIGDTVFVYYEKQGKVVALGSKHMNGDSHPDFQHPENKMLTSCNKMVKFTPQTIELVGNRKQYDGTGDAAFQAQIEFNTEQGICVYSKQDITIKAEQNIRIESLKEFINIEEPANKFDSMHDAGEAKYMADGGINV